MYEEYQQYFNLMGITSAPAMATFVVLMLWALVWKGIALWKAARNGAKAWYVVLLIANTVGILEIIYIFFFSKKKNQQNN